MTEITELEYFDVVLNSLIKFKDDLREKIFDFKNIDRNHKAIKEKQVYLVRNGLFDRITRMWSTIEENDFLKQSIGPAKQEIIREEILEMFTILTYENPFLIVLCFTKVFCNLIFQSDVTKNEINFFNHKLKVLKKYKYKINIMGFLGILDEKLEKMKGKVLFIILFL